MKDAPADLHPPRPAENLNTDWQAWTFFAALFGLAAINRQSLWIDEAMTAVKAMQPDFHSWWASMMAERSADLQKPGYMLYIWAFARLCGSGEWALRAGNVPWFVAGFACVARAIPGRRKIAMALVMLFSPFVWYYLAEACPYAMQIGSSLMIFGALYALSHPDCDVGWPDGVWVAVFLFGLVALSSSSLLGMIWAGSALLCALAALRRKGCLELARENIVSVSIAALLLTLLAGYYLWTLKVGARASDVGATSLLNIGFILYELLGLAGLGPGRMELRREGVHALLAYTVPLAIYGLLTANLLWAGLKTAFRKGSSVNGPVVGAALLLPTLFILGTGVIEHFRVLGRHFTPLLPVFFILLSLGLRERLVSDHWRSRFITILFMGFSLVSCLSFHLAERHEKDDYRGAAAQAVAKLKAGGVVWWNAAYEGGLYYGVPLELKSAPGSKIQYLMNAPAGRLAALPQPDLVVKSKPDVFDGGGCLSHYLASHGFTVLARYKAFEIWQRPAMPRR